MKGGKEWREKGRSKKELGREGERERSMIAPST